MADNASHAVDGGVQCVSIGAAVSRGVPEECVSEHRRGGARRETTASERESVYMVAHRSQVACAHATGKCTVLDPNEYTYHVRLGKGLL